MPGARELVLKGLYQMEEKGAYANQALQELLENPALEAQDRAFAAELLLGVVRNRRKLDFVIAQFSKLRLKKLSPWVLANLRMAVYQMLWMDRVPDRAACSEAAKLVGRYANPGARGYSNGVLRAIAREKEKISYPTAPLTERLGVAYSFPDWMVEALLEDFGPAVCEEILAETHRPHPPTLRVNPLRITQAALMERLAQEGIQTRPLGDTPGCLLVEGSLRIHRSPAYAQGLYTLQNPSSMAAVAALDPQPGELILDLCAAPGGKTTGMAERMGDQGRIVACDLYPHKAALIENAARRLGLASIEARVQDAAAPMPEFLGRADRVLADVPCSGLGVIHKKPDIKWRRKPEDIPALCEIQAAIFHTAAGYVKPGGTLVYSTCTLLRAENQAQVQAFLKGHPAFTLEAERLLLTHETGGSGFYIAKLRRQAE